MLLLLLLLLLLLMLVLLLLLLFSLMLLGLPLLLLPTEIPPLIRRPPCSAAPVQRLHLPHILQVRQQTRPLAGQFA